MKTKNVRLRKKFKCVRLRFFIKLVNNIFYQLIEYFETRFHTLFLLIFFPLHDDFETLIINILV